MSEQLNKDMSKHFYRASAADFMKIPGSPVAYWLSKKIIDNFDNTKSIGNVIPVRGGMTTADNDSFVRLWTEVSKGKIGKHYWAPYNKGGEYRKWYGNQSWVVLWHQNGKSIKSTGRASVRSEEFYFKKMIGWTDITSFSQLGVRFYPDDFIFDASGPSLFPNNEKEINVVLGFLASNVTSIILNALNPTLHVQAGNIASLPFPELLNANYLNEVVKKLVNISKADWDSLETSWNFKESPLLGERSNCIRSDYQALNASYKKIIDELRDLEEDNNTFFITLFDLSAEVDPSVKSEELTLNCNPHYRYSGDRSDEECETLQQCDTIKELLSYVIGCMMGRYSLDKPGLILSSQGETIQDYLAQIPSPKYMPDDDAILPLTDQEWFTDDVTNRFREFVKVVWGEETLQENLEFVAESLCLHAIKPKKSETAMETIRRYLSTQFFADHMRTYKKRPIYWLFSSGKQKAFECLVYLHRYNEGTLSRMRTEYVTPLMGKYESQIRHIEEQQETATTAEKNKLSKALKGYQSKLNELREFDNKLKHYADRRISLDLDDGVKVNYGKFGDLLANVKDITGKKPT